MITQVTASKLIDAPVRRVYDQWTQFEEFPHFMSAVRSVQQLDDTHTRWDVEIGGVRRQFDATITEQIPDRKIRWESAGEKAHVGEVEFEPEGDGTRVDLSMSWAPEGFVEKVGAVLNLDEMAAERDLAMFATFIADRPAPTGAWRGRVADEPSAPSALPGTEDPGVDPDIRL